MFNLISIYTGGVITLIMALFHTLFYKTFKWKKDYERITELNKKIFHTIHLALLILFFLIGAFTLIYAVELSKSTGIALGINLIFSIFWFWRTAWQIIYFKGKVMHYVLIVMFLLLFISYLIPVVFH